MKFLSTILARSIWLFPIKDINPRGIYIENVLDEIIERYSFTRKVANNNDVNNDIIFTKGQFVNSQNENIEISLNFHSDGLVAESFSSTNNCDEFLEDLLAWLHTEFLLEDYKDLIRKKVYVSHVFIQSNNSLSLINPKFQSFQQKLEMLITGHEPASFEVSSISFGTDPQGLSRPVPFRVERAVDAAFKDNRFYSSGPFTTEVHLSLLKEFDELLDAAI